MSLDEAFAKINKAFGTGTVMRLGEDASAKVEVIPSGSIALDRALGIGGYPRGRIVEVYGPESSGKSTLALHAAASGQRVGSVAYIDTEHSIDPVYAAALGVDVEKLIITQPDNAEQALEVAEILIDSGELSVLILDSVAAMVPRRELEGDYGDSNVGLHARLMSQAMRKLTGRVKERNVLFLAINQLRQKVGVVYGSPEVTTGGVALKYYSSIRLDVRRIETEKQGTEAVGNRTRVKVVKNKLAPPLRQAEFSIVYGLGIHRGTELVDLAVDAGVIVKAGPWFKYGELKWQGKASAVVAVDNVHGLAAEIEGKL